MFILKMLWYWNYSLEVLIEGGVDFKELSKQKIKENLRFLNMVVIFVAQFLISEYVQDFFYWK